MILAALGWGYGELALAQQALEAVESRTQEGKLRVVAPGETLFSISREWSEQTGTTLAQSIYGIYRANPEAFGSRGIGGLRAGATLRLPSAEVLRQLSPREAATAVSRALGQKSEPGQVADTTPESPAEDSEPVEVASQIEEPRVISGRTVETETPPASVRRPLDTGHTTLSPKWFWSPWLWGGLGVMLGALGGFALARTTRRTLNTASAAAETALSSEEIARLATQCAEQADCLGAVDETLRSGRLTHGELFEFYVQLSQEFQRRKDPMTAASFLAQARERISPGQHDRAGVLLKQYLALGDAQTASDIAIDIGLVEALPSSLGETELAGIRAGYERTRRQVEAVRDHGHVLLIEHLEKHLPAIRTNAQRELVLIEIGSTREQVASQGSTEKLARFCQQHGLKMITVDMDPHNTGRAEALFRSMGDDSLQAVNEKGEEFLTRYEGVIDFLFLDAYDFDHGHHSDLRQSRYERFLGAPINDPACHQMHLACAQAAESKLAQWSVICIDDTWLSEGAWQAKGTLAMPYLLSRGFQLLEARNRAALLAPPAATTKAAA